MTRLENLNEQKQGIEDIIDELSVLKDRLDDVMGNENWDGQPRAYYEAYGCCGLQRALGEGNPYDQSLIKLLEDLDEQIEEEIHSDKE